MVDGRFKFLLWTLDHRQWTYYHPDNPLNKLALRERSYHPRGLTDKLIQSKKALSGTKNSCFYGKKE
jgi:hypothetical protein